MWWKHRWMNSTMFEYTIYTWWESLSSLTKCRLCWFELFVVLSWPRDGSRLCLGDGRPIPSIHRDLTLLPFMRRGSFLVIDDGITYDVFSYVFSVILWIWRQIRSQLEELSLVCGTFWIVFIRVVVIHFYPKSCNSKGVL
jgi:hypothetical protein